MRVTEFSQVSKALVTLIRLSSIKLAIGLHKIDHVFLQSWISISGCPGPLISAFENQQARALENYAAQNLNTASHKFERTLNFVAGKNTAQI